MAESLKVELRSDFGKGFARRARVAGQVPGVLYGHGTDPVHLLLPQHEIALISRNPNALLELEIPEADSELAIIKDVQRHPLTRALLHVDLLLVKRGEKVQVDVPVIIEGEPTAPAVAMIDLQTVTVEADALNLPESIVINVEGKEEGENVFAGDLKLEKGVELVTDAELVVVGIGVPQVDEADLEPVVAEDEEAEGEESAEAAEAEEEAATEEAAE